MNRSAVAVGTEPADAIKDMELTYSHLGIVMIGFKLDAPFIHWAAIPEEDMAGRPDGRTGMIEQLKRYDSRGETLAIWEDDEKIVVVWRDR
jgi:hypothetical protein